jgi:hypothetical protein
MLECREKAGPGHPLHIANRTLIDYYRIPQELLDRVTFIDDAAAAETGFFQFGKGTTCFGRCQLGVAATAAGAPSFDASKHVHFSGNAIQLPFNFAEVVQNLRWERYAKRSSRGLEPFPYGAVSHKLYYSIRSSLPFPVRRQLQRLYFQDWKRIPFPTWPVDATVDTLHERALRLAMEAASATRWPFIWFWPNGAPNCLIMTHDVETAAGRDFTAELIELDASYGFKAAFQVVPEQRYTVSDEYVSAIRSRGCEFNIHDLNHDGRLYSERSEFARRAAEINNYARKYAAAGFRAGAMYRRQDWFDLFDFSYDMSVSSVAHLDPLRGGCCTVMPYFVGKILEIPLTTTQDYTVFHILNDFSIDLWKQQVALIRERNGLMSFLAHPDYLIERPARKVYESLLDYLRKTVADEGIWVALPGEVDGWWRARSQMKLVNRNGNWQIEGPQKERATIAYASLEGDRLQYALA